MTEEPLSAQRTHKNRRHNRRRAAARLRRIVHLTYGEPVGERGFAGYRTACGRIREWGRRMVGLGDEIEVTCPACLRDWMRAACDGIPCESAVDLAMRTTCGTGRSPRRKWGI